MFDALRIIERSDLTSAEMIGAWAGEIGQTQFLPSAYLRFAVDFEGNGRRDLIHSSLNALASTANYLKNYGWVSGKPWTEAAANFLCFAEMERVRGLREDGCLFRVSA